ncbi:MAG: hypothetical protein Q7J84_13190 [Sulfuricaulis sp.]|nr:hypothetical protein [Sulfuricaulis sp.]
MKTFLHVGCGPIYFDSNTQQAQRIKGFASQEWQELRLDINPQVNRMYWAA